MRPSLFTLLLAACAAAVLPSPAAAQLSVDQLVTQLRPADGRTSIVIDVRNDGSERVAVEIAVNDWQVDEEGQHRFLPVGTVAESCGGRLQPDGAAVRIDPGATAAVRVFYDGSATHRCRNIVFFRVTELPAALEGDRLIISTGVKVYVER